MRASAPLVGPPAPAAPPAGAVEDRWRRSFRRSAVAVAVLAGVVAVLCSGLVPSGTHVADYLSYPLEAVAAACCVPVVRRSSGRTRLTWSLVLALLVLWWVADLCWLGAELLPAAAPLDSAATVLYLLGTVPIACALFVVPVGRWEEGAAGRVVLDVLVLSFSILAAADVLVLHTVVGTSWSWDTVVAVWYPTSDVLLASGALALGRRLAGRTRTDLLLAATAFAVYAVTDLGYSWVELRGVDFYRTPLAAGYTVAPLLLGLAALAARRDTGVLATRPMQRHARTRTLSVVPDAAVLGAGVTCIAVPPSSWHEWTLVVLGAGAALVRSVLTEVDAAALRGQLEERVERRTAELAELGDRNARVLESMTEGVVGVGEGGRPTFLNDVAHRLLGTAGSGVVVPAGPSVCELLGVHGPTACPVHQVLRDGGTEVARSRTASGVPVEVTVSPMVAGAGHAEVLVSVRDLTEHEEVEELKREFVTAVSHELRTPLSAVRGALELLADGDAGELPPAAVRLVETAARGGARLTRLVDDIIDVERLAAGTFDVRPAAQAAAPLLHRTCDAMAAVADQAGVALVVGRTVATQVLADSGRMEQVLTNLVGNAVKFSPRGSTVSLSCADGTGPGGPEVVLAVSDQGRGIPAEDLTRVFERFQQVSVADGRTLGGAGLGLTIARSIVELHGGRIWATSQLGRGTTFLVALPAATATTASTVACSSHVPPSVDVVDRVPRGPAAVERQPAASERHPVPSLP